jgi:predicted metal-dependent peptidase
MEPTVLPEDSELKPCVLTPKQEGEWETTMTLLQWTAPGFQHIFYRLLTNNENGGVVPTRDVPVAATDGRNIMVNPEEFFKYPLKERVFVTAHEIVHNVFDDVNLLHRCHASGTVPMDDGTTLPFRESTMQKAMDFRINALLRDSNIGVPPTGCLLDDEIAKAHDGVYDVYRRVYDDEENNNGKKTGGKGFDTVLKPGASGGKSVPRNAEQWAVEITAAQTIQRHHGKGMGALKKMFDDLLNPVVPWTDHIRGIFNRKVGAGSYDWRKADRRMIVRDIYYPRRSGNGAGWVVCWGDTSGSCISEVNKFLAELAGIVEDCQPQRLTVVWCDDGIQRIDEIADPTDLETTRYEGAPGGGGTSVSPVFDWIADHTETPEVFIGFTDGYVTFPKEEPRIPVIIWAMTTDQTAPWGDHVRLNPKK